MIYLASQSGFVRMLLRFEVVVPKEPTIQNSDPVPNLPSAALERRWIRILRDARHRFIATPLNQRKRKRWPKTAARTGQAIRADDAGRNLRLFHREVIPGNVSTPTTWGWPIRWFEEQVETLVAIFRPIASGSVNTPESIEEGRPAIRGVVRAGGAQ